MRSHYYRQPRRCWGEVQQGFLLTWRECSKRIASVSHIQKIQTRSALDRVGIEDYASFGVCVVAIAGIRQGGDFTGFVNRHVSRI